MKKHFLWKGVAVATFLIFSMSVFHVAAQPRGGGRLGGGGAKIGGGGASKANFGGGSVVHRNFTPPANTPRPNIKPSVPSADRPKMQPGSRPNLPEVPKRPTPRPDQGGRDLLPGDLKPQRPGGGGAKAPDRKPINRPDAGRSDGPDWKNWSNIDKSKIHDTVVNRAPVNRDTVDRVRNHFDDHFADKKIFSKDWFDKHPDGWRPPGPGPHPPHPHPLPPPPPHFWWHHPNWDHTWGWFAAGFVTGVVVDAIVEPIVYDYGSNIVYHDETVYVNNVPYVDADTYYQQAVDLAEAGAAEKTSEEPAEPAKQSEGTAGEWLSMGTFAVVADGKEKASDRIVQLATNKDGQIRGNLVDPKDDETVELYGSVDPKTQRVAFKIAGNDDCVAECGLWNLTQDTVPLLVHVDKDRTEERTLVRLDNKDVAGKE